jgi:HAD superfamily hydrolase (TIGR01549 family)
LIKYCVFDIGGVLVKTDIGLLISTKLSLTNNGLKPPPDHFIISNFGVGSYKNIRESVKKVYSGTDLEKKVENCYEDYVNIFPEKILNNLSLFPNVIETLMEIKKNNILLACQTGFTKYEAEIILNNFKLKSFFDLIVTDDDVTKTRPNPEAMETVQRILKIKSNEILYVGDTASDILFANNAAVPIACVTTGAQKKEDLMKHKPNFLINDISEVIDIIKDMNS